VYRRIGSTLNGDYCAHCDDVDRDRERFPRRRIGWKGRETKVVRGEKTKQTAESIAMTKIGDEMFPCETISATIDHRVDTGQNRRTKTTERRVSGAGECQYFVIK